MAGASSSIKIDNTSKHSKKNIILVVLLVIMTFIFLFFLIFSFSARNFSKKARETVKYMEQQEQNNKVQDSNSAINSVIRDLTKDPQAN